MSSLEQRIIRERPQTEKAKNPELKAALLAVMAAFSTLQEPTAMAAEQTDATAVKNIDIQKNLEQQLANLEKTNALDIETLKQQSLRLGLGVDAGVGMANFKNGPYGSNDGEVVQNKRKRIGLRLEYTMPVKKSGYVLVSGGIGGVATESTYLGGSHPDNSGFSDSNSFLPYYTVGIEGGVQKEVDNFFDDKATLGIGLGAEREVVAGNNMATGTIDKASLTVRAEDDFSPWHVAVHVSAVQEQLKNKGNPSLGMESAVTVTYTFKQ